MEVNVAKFMNKKYLWIFSLLILLISICVVELLFAKYGWSRKNSLPSDIIIIYYCLLNIFLLQSLKYAVNKSRKKIWLTIFFFQVLFIIVIIIVTLLLIVNQMF